jgi:predicted Zn-dependent protease
MSIERFSALLEHQPGNDLFRFSLAKALCDAARWAESVPHLERCCDAKRDWMLPRILLGKAHLALGADGDARRVLNDALALAREQQHEDPEAEILALLDGIGPG